MYNYTITMALKHDIISIVYHCELYSTHCTVLQYKECLHEAVGTQQSQRIYVYYG